MKIDQLGGIQIGRKRPLLILEAGVNHEGSLQKALETVEAAAEAGAPAIKFQSYKAETLASIRSPAYWDRSKEPAENQFELFKRYDAFGEREYALLAERCQQQGILFLSTAFDRYFVGALDPLMPGFKVASADITNFPLLREIGRRGKPVLLSTGAADVSEIRAALEVLLACGADQVALMHCVLEYPTRPGHANLMSIPYLHSRFPECTLGWSDHVPYASAGQSLLTAWLLGADILEKHFTLDKDRPGNDHYHAMDPDDVREFLARLDYTRALLGERKKEVLPWERDAKKFARRSLVARRPIPAGTRLAESMLTEKRPGTGISPACRERVLGREVSRAIETDEVLRWDDLFAASR